MQDKLENNYSVYQHVTPDGMYYFGQTNNIKRRWRNNGAEYKGTSLYPYIEKFGWDNIQHIVLFKDQTRENALWIENFLIETAQEDGVCINKQRSGLVSKEDGYKQQYYEQNKEKVQERQKQYYEINKGQISEQKKQYYETNKEKVQERQKQYYEQNKQQILEQQQQYYEQNKQQILEQKQQYYEENKQQIRKQQKQYYEQNKQQRRKYQRQYYQRKKEEQQFKELGCLPLW